MGPTVCLIATTDGIQLLNKTQTPAEAVHPSGRDTFCIITRYDTRESGLNVSYSQKI
jgi:hypothetical protein